MGKASHDRVRRRSYYHRTAAWCLLSLAMLRFSAAVAVAESTLPDLIQRDVQPKIVKVYGAGGLSGLEAYQSGFLISAEGHVLTAWSYVLDSDFTAVTLNDGRKFQAELVGADPRLEIAVLKITASEELPHFKLDEAAKLELGDRVLAFSNLYGVATGDEAASVLHGRVSATTRLAARRGAFETPYEGPVYVLDAMTNNPGAAGGALTDRRGRLAAMLGKELRNSLNNTWLNYAIPVAELSGSIQDILAGKTRPRSLQDDQRKPVEPVTLAQLGIVLVPDVLGNTPPFVDRVLPDSPAERAGVQIDDLILFVNDRLAKSCELLREELSYIDRLDQVRLMVQRDQTLVEIPLQIDN